MKPKPPVPRTAAHVQAALSSVQRHVARPVAPVPPAPRSPGIQPHSTLPAPAAQTHIGAGAARPVPSVPGGSRAVTPPARAAQLRPAAPPLPSLVRREAVQRAAAAVPLRSSEPASQYQRIIAPPPVALHLPTVAVPAGLPPAPGGRLNAAAAAKLSAAETSHSVQRAVAGLDFHQRPAWTQKILQPSPRLASPIGAGLILPRQAGFQMTHGGQVPGVPGLRLPFTNGAPILQMSRLGDIGLSFLNFLGAVSFSNFFFRIPRLIEHIVTGPLKLIRWIWNGFKSLVGYGNLTFMEWLKDGLLGGASWLGRLFTKVVDVLGFAEIVDFISNVCKGNSRRLNAGEETAARVVYGSSLPYWKVRVDDTGTGFTDFYNAIVQLVTGIPGGNMIAVTVFHTVELDPVHAMDLNNIVHELGHVKQYEVAGSQYMGEAIHAALAGAGYNYQAVDLLNHNLSWFNREQQCRIAEHYWAIHESVNLGAAQHLVPSLGGVNLGVALASPLAPVALTPRGVALAIYGPRIQEFRRGQIGGASLVDLAWGRLRY